MAVNESDNDSINESTIKKDFGISELERIGRSYSSTTAQERELIRRLNENIEARDDMDKLAAKMQKTKFSSSAAKTKWERALEDRRERISKTANSIVNRIGINNEAKQERMNRQAVNVVQRAFSDSNVNGAVNSAAMSPDIQARGMSLTNQSWQALSAQQEQIWSTIAQRRADSLEKAEYFIGSDGVDTFTQEHLASGANEMKGFVNQLATTSVAMNHLRARGLDPKSQQLHLSKMEQKAESILGYRQIQNDIRNGTGLGGLSGSELKKKEEEAATKLVDALRELRLSAGKTKEELEGLNKKAKEAADEMEEIAEVKAAGGGRGGNGAKLVQAYGTAISNVAAITGNTIQAMGVSIPMAQVGNIAGFANLENQKYDMWTSAVAGDMSARMNLSGWKGAANFGSRLDSNMGSAVMARAIGGGAGAVASGAQLAEAVSDGWIGDLVGNADYVNKIAQGAQGVLENASSAAISAVDYSTKASSGQANVAGQNAFMQAHKQLTHIPGRQLQQWRDYLMGLRGAAVNLGTSADSFIDEAGGSAFIAQVRELGMSPEEISHLSQQGSTQLGSMFNTSTVLEARKMENRGLGSSSENMRRMAALASAGTQNPSTALASMIEAGMARGLSSSKALTMIAEHTGEMAKQSAMGGMFDVSGALSKLLMSGIDSGNPNQELAAEKEFTSYATAEQVRNNRGASFSGMTAVSRLQRDLGLGYKSAFSLQGVNGADLHAMAAMSKEEAQHALFSKGVDVSGNTAFQSNYKGWFSSLLQDKVMTGVENGGKGIFFGAPAGWQKALGWIGEDQKRAEAWINGDETVLKKAGLYQANLAMRQSIRSGDASADASQRMRDQLAFIGVLHPNLRKDLGSGKIGNGAFGNLQGDYSLGGQQKLSMVEQAMKLFDVSSGKSSAEALFSTGKVTRDAAGQDAETRWAEAAAKSAKDFGESAMKLNEASGKLTEAATQLAMVAALFDTTSLPNNFNQKPPIKRLHGLPF